MYLAARDMDLENGERETESRPRSYGLLLFPGFEVLDATGPTELLNCLSQHSAAPELQMSVISSNMEPVTPAFGAKTSAGYKFQDMQVFMPTHTFDTVPNLDVLIVPGGAGTRAFKAETKRLCDFIRSQYYGSEGRDPLRYIFSVCNGTKLLAEAGILHGHRATTNKKQWSEVTGLTRDTHWVARARWVASGNIWTCSGVSAGMDGMAAFIEKVYGERAAAEVCDDAEYIRHVEGGDDPFAERFRCSDVLGGS